MSFEPELEIQELLQNLRSKATELFLREEWQDSINLYTQIINLSKQQQQQSTDTETLTKTKRSLCLALSNRAEAYFRLKSFTKSIEDCDRALQIESTHFKSLLCKGRILLSLNKYSLALEYFRLALLDPQASGYIKDLNGYIDKCKRFELQSKTGAFDLSDWISSGFREKSPELGEYVGAVKIARSQSGGRGLFATKNVDVGTVMLVTKAIAIERGILSSCENAQLVMWKSFIDKVVESTIKCNRTCRLISTLSSGEDEDKLDVPDISFFRVEADGCDQLCEELDKDRILSILDVNSLVEDSVSAKVLGKNSDYYGVGLWLLASFINHTCNPNARRLHVGDYVLVIASRDVKVGEEISFAYSDVLTTLEKRKEMSKTWGFECCCRRCKFEEEFCSMQEVKEMEVGLERGIDLGAAIYRLEESMKKWMVRGKEKGYLRASFWSAYAEAYASEKILKRWGRRIPPVDTVVESIVEVIGSDERLLKVAVEKVRRNGSSMMEMEKVMKLARGIYGKLAKKQAIRSLLGLGIYERRL